MTTISFSEALEHIEAFCKPASKISIPIENSMGLLLAEDIISPIHMPPFRQSSMDGYAFIHSDITSYKIVGEIPAGSAQNICLKTGEAVRIFTGARIPDNADTVVIQEHVERTNDRILIKKKPVKDSNIRALGAQIKVNEIALKKGTLLNEASIGFLACLGVSTVTVHKKPIVSILITGNELEALGNDLEEGKVYESNSITLKLALKKLRVKDIHIVRVKDDLESTTSAIKNCINTSDIVLVSGGISVGDYDFVKLALVNNAVSEIFYKVNQKPGKPLWFGYSDQTTIFALPGNPASSLSCFYLYVLPLIKAKLGYKNYHLPRRTAVLANLIQNDHGKTLFLKATIAEGEAHILSGQASSILKSFALCNALVIIPPEKKVINKGEQITYIPL